MALMIHCRECAQTWWRYKAMPVPTTIPYASTPLQQVTLEHCWQHQKKPESK